MKSYEQRTDDITKKAKGIVARRKAWISAVACVCCVAIVTGVIFATLPTNSDDPVDITAYEKSEYFPLIQKIHSYNQEHSSDFGNASGGGWWDRNEQVDGAAPGAPSPDEGSSGTPDTPTTPDGDRYEESTQNQVDGVTEGDILKRSKNYAFYLTTNWERVLGSKLSYYFQINAYTIAGENSTLVGKFAVKAENGVTFSTGQRVYTDKTEMYLSEDAKTLTLVTDCFNKNYVHYTCVISLDVSQPSKITEKSRTYVAGSYVSSRKVNGELLIVTNFYVPSNPDFDKPETFIPSCGAMSNRTYWKMDEIYCPEYLTDCTYTVVAKMNESDLQVTSKQAVLSYTYDVMVSAEHIFVIRNHHEYVQNDQSKDYLDIEDGEVYYHVYSEIVSLEYVDKLNSIGSVKLDGFVNDRYSLDEKGGILRAVTETTRYDYNVTRGNGSTYPRLSLADSMRSASLHCVDLEQMKVVSSVENFAENGETVQAVRFRGDDAYVCTAFVNTDPVFVFNLSDIHNITYKDTGTIPGYSINLMKFGDYLLGIGYGEISTTLKIELYNEADSSVESVAIYENDDCRFSTEYKAHFIDDEHQLVGLQIVDYMNPTNTEIYLLLQFDSATQTWRELLRQEVSGQIDLARAFYADGFYLICGGTALQFFPESSL